MAGMEEAGNLLRLYPVPFRLMSDTAQFKKWQWIEVDIEKARNDHRTESHRIRVDNIKCIGEPLTTKNKWGARREWLNRLPCFDSFAALDAARLEAGTTLGLLRPSAILGLDIAEARHPDWTEDERAKLLQAQSQGDLFDDQERRSISTLQKILFDFHYRYRDLEGPQRHKIVDWEAGALYRHVSRDHGANWEKPFRDKIERELPAKDLMFLMGTIHRFPDQWLIVSLIYPPKLP
ncbi:MAG TPA: hypothetical protein VE046_11595 [Steroidobacteraceae bacterium]|nr:hypothetical protein [Steroidobacteraceae bacterium]